MKQYIIIGTIIMIIFILIFNFSNFKNAFTGKIIENPYTYSFTKAICNSTNFCQDYEIICEGNKTKKISPLTGASIQFDRKWKDPRSEKTKNTLCAINNSPLP